MGADADGTNGYLGVDGSGRIRVCGRGRYGGYSQVGTDVIAKNTVNQKFDFDCMLTFLREEKEHFIFIHSLHMPITTFLC
jgi:hypothetical protein